MNILIIGDNEQSDIVKVVQRQKLVPLIRRSILATLEVLKHFDIEAIIIDNDYKGLDILELMLNIREINYDTPFIITLDKPIENSTALYKEIGFDLIMVQKKNLENTLKSFLNKNVVAN